MMPRHKNEEPTIKVTVKVPFHLHYQAKLSLARTGQTFQKFLLGKLQNFVPIDVDSSVPLQSSSPIQNNGQSE